MARRKDGYGHQRVSKKASKILRQIKELKNKNRGSKQRTAKRGRTVAGFSESGRELGKRVMEVVKQTPSVPQKVEEVGGELKEPPHTS